MQQRTITRDEFRRSQVSYYQPGLPNCTSDNPGKYHYDKARLFAAGEAEPAHSEKSHNQTYTQKPLSFSQDGDRDRTTPIINFNTLLRAYVPKRWEAGQAAAQHILKLAALKRPN